MKSCSVDLEQMLAARERRAAIQSRMLGGADGNACLACLTLNIAGDVKRTPMTKMLFDHGVQEFEALGLSVEDSLIIDEATGSEAFWLLGEEGAGVKMQLEEIEDAFPAARLYDFDLIMPGGAKLSRRKARKCLICDAPAAECARSRRHGLEAVRRATDDLLKGFCSDVLAEAAYRSLLDELHATPKPGLVDMNSNGSHADMDAELLEKSADALRPYFADAARMGMEGCGMAALRERGRRAENEMFAATCGVNTHKGLIYSMGLLLAGMGRCLREGGECTEHAAALARDDAEERLAASMADPSTNGGRAYRNFGARGATGEAAAGFPGAKYCLSRLSLYRKEGREDAAVLALCDSMAALEDTNLLHRGGPEGLKYVRDAAARISALPPEERTEELYGLDRELTDRGLSPGGSADMLAAALLLERWRDLSGSGT